MSAEDEYSLWEKSLPEIPEEADVAILASHHALDYFGTNYEDSEALTILMNNKVCQVKK